MYVLPFRPPSEQVVPIFACLKAREPGTTPPPTVRSAHRERGCRAARQRRGNRGAFGGAMPGLPARLRRQTECPTGDAPRRHGQAVWPAKGGEVFAKGAKWRSARARKGAAYGAATAHVKLSPWPSFDKWPPHRGR